jgi:hypothetical protein
MDRFPFPRTTYYLLADQTLVLTTVLRGPFAVKGAVEGGRPTPLAPHRLPVIIRYFVLAANMHFICRPSFRHKTAGIKSHIINLINLLNNTEINPTLHNEISIMIMKSDH